MILKIKQQSQEDGVSDRWWVLGEIAKVSYAMEPMEGFYVGNEKDPKTDKLHADIVLVNPMASVKDDELQTVPVNRIVARDIRDKETVILFNTVAYLCNDRGETIEKIVGNHW